jgi:hypothetical protein
MSVDLDAVDVQAASAGHAVLEEPAAAEGQADLADVRRGTAARRLWLR